MSTKPYWIKERFNPQLGTYYSECGQMSKTAAKKMERPLYGENKMHCFETEEAYRSRIIELKECGERVS